MKLGKEDWSGRSRGWKQEETATSINSSIFLPIVAANEICDASMRKMKF